MPKLLIGFDSAWTPNNSGAIAAVLHRDDGTFHEIGEPLIANYRGAERVIARWQAQFPTASTLIMLDQPTIVVNRGSQRPVEGIVAPSVSVRLGGMQPANLSRTEMFGPEAPVWKFLQCFGCADPFFPGDTIIYETYPVLTLIALGWTLPHERVTGRLPKYNPARTKTFSLADWQHVCALASVAFLSRGLSETAKWLEQAGSKPYPRKPDQDRLDACLCLLTAMHLAEGRDGLFIGDVQTGYIVVPYRQSLFDELAARCRLTGRNPADCVRIIRNGKLAATPAGLVTSSPAPRPAKTKISINAPVKTPEFPSARLPHDRAWNLRLIASQLDLHRQRATYGAVAKLLGVLPRGLMNGRAKSPEYSWIVAASGPQRGWPTGYAVNDIHPDCMRQIQGSSATVIENPEHMRRWLESRTGTAPQ